ncbi:MAG: hypothetical protein K6F10_00425 [Paludibacteraceae bacterium]|nr:hypothetical protein [Paludibacteraceae bacterium]
MKKCLFLAVALVASVLTFTSCDKKDNANSPLVGVWSYTNEPNSDGWYNVLYVIFKADGSFEFQDEAHDPANPSAHDVMLFVGKYEVKGDVITAHFLQHGWIHGSTREYVEPFDTFDEQIRYVIEDNKLTLTRQYGTSSPYTEVYLKSNATLN